MNAVWVASSILEIRIVGLRLKEKESYQKMTNHRKPILRKFQYEHLWMECK